MDLVRTAAELRARLKNERSVVLVPTMGNLHAGHIALVQAARERGGCVVTTISCGAGYISPSSGAKATWHPACASMAQSLSRVRG